MSIESLAAATGMCAQEVHWLENGIKRLSPSMLLDFADAMDVPISYFFDLIATCRGDAKKESLIRENLLPMQDFDVASHEAEQILVAFRRITLSPYRQHTLRLLSSVERLLKEIGCSNG
ncbi:MAG: helix-turn-helix transcriptional regulator [Acidisphaera sp.]|nr:helix-turn-helix transcriptional regulator [Acidisphaera sp.]